MLNVHGLQFDYGDKPLLQDVSFSLEAGAVLHIKGANGAGKTTLLKLLAGLLCPTEGKINYTTKNKKHICYVGHKAGVNARLTPREHARLDLESNLSDTAIHDALVRLKLHDVQDTLCGLLSAGQRRRAGLLQLLSSNALLWLLDEPLVALDQASVKILGDTLLAHLKAGGGVVLTSHQSLPFDFPVLKELVL